MPSPISAMQKLTANSERNPAGAAASRAKASSGPSIAPVVSSARCTPNAAPSRCGAVAREIIASRGAVRMPFPTRSRNTTAPIAGMLAPASTRPRRHSAEMPYPAPAIVLWLRPRSAANAVTSATSAAAPL